MLLEEKIAVRPEINTPGLRIIARQSRWCALKAVLETKDANGQTSVNHEVRLTALHDEKRRTEDSRPARDDRARVSDAGIQSPLRLGPEKWRLLISLSRPGDNYSCAVLCIPARCASSPAYQWPRRCNFYANVQIILLAHLEHRRFLRN